MEKHRGQLKIFFSYAAGVGKTSAMLHAALISQQAGKNVLIGYVAEHEKTVSKDVLAQLKCLPMKGFFNGHSFENEFNIDGALKCHPDLLVIDELAHHNFRGSRHSCRYKDVEELLKAGINVYTTLNIQDIEGLSDIVCSITGRIIDEKVPDVVFDKAEQIELIDCEPIDILSHLHFKNHLDIEQLSALREVTLRRCAERIHIINSNKENANHYLTNEHILVCISSSPSNQKIIRTAARLSKMFHGDLTAIYVTTDESMRHDDVSRQQLGENLQLAKRLGAHIEQISHDDIAFQIAEFAHHEGVSKIVLGRSPSRHWPFSKPNLVDKLTALAPDLDIYIIPSDVQRIPHHSYQHHKMHISAFDMIKSISILFVVTMLSFLFKFLGFSEANIITIYILGVLLIAVTTNERIYSIISSVVSVCIFNFFFTDPYFTFQAYGSGYPVTFIIMFMAAFITSGLMVKVKQNASHSAKMAFRTKILLDTNQLLQKENNQERIVTVTCQQLSKLLQMDVIFYCANGNKLGEPFVLPYHSGTDLAPYTNQYEKIVADWVFHNNHHAGASTNTLANAKCLYLAIRINRKVYGVVGLHLNQQILNSFESDIVLSILGEAALALENEQSIREKLEADLRAKNEQLRANLLRSISHDLRTPLTSISGNAGMLLTNEDFLTQENRQHIYKDIYDDSFWLMNLVENLLSVTRIEQGMIHMKRNVELMDEIISEALSYMKRHMNHHEIQVIEDNELILVEVDARLIIQVIVNILDNAVKYTPEYSKIVIHSYIQDQVAYVDIADEGKGIPDSAKEKVFQMFYTENKKTADSRRSLGLGLALCQSIMKAHDGDICVIDNCPQGSIFRIILPIKEVKLHE